MRKRFLSEKLTELIDRKKTKEAKKIKDVLNSEAHKKQWQGVYQVTTPEKAGIITYVDVPQPDGTTVRCNTNERWNGRMDKRSRQGTQGRGAHQSAKDCYSGCWVTRLK